MQGRGFVNQTPESEKTKGVNVLWLCIGCSVLHFTMNTTILVCHIGSVI